MVRLPLSICLVMSVDAVKTVAHLIGAKIMAFVARCEKVTQCKTICVFDGFSPVSKAEEAAARKIRRDKALKAVKTILESPVKIEPRRKKTHKVSLLSRKAKQAIRFSDLRDEIVSFLRDAEVAVSLEPEEADYKIAAMALETPTIILSTDSDFFFRPGQWTCFRPSAGSVRGIGQILGTYCAKRDVINAIFGSMAVPPIVEDRMLLVLFAGLRNDYQKSKPRQLKLSKWREAIKTVGCNAANNQLDCRSLGELAVQICQQATPGLSDSSWSHYKDGIKISLDAVLDGVFTTQYLTGFPRDFGILNFDREKLSVPYDIEQSRLAAAAEISKFVLSMSDKVKHSPSF